MSEIDEILPAAPSSHFHNMRKPRKSAKSAPRSPFPVCTLLRCFATLIISKLKPTMEAINKLNKLQGSILIYASNVAALPFSGSTFCAMLVMASLNAVAGMMSSAVSALSHGSTDSSRGSWSNNLLANPPHSNQRNDAVTMYYKAPERKVLPPGLEDVGVTDTTSVCAPLSEGQIQDSDESDETCGICFDSFGSSRGPSICLKACGHKFHLGCIQEAMRHQTSPKCPECRTMVLPEALIPGRLQGNMPSGTMTIQRYPYYSCQGYEGDGSIAITYRINSGMQKPYHPHPGRRHGSAYRTAYLPDNQDGRDLLVRLQFAFLHGLTFTVGTSLTSGRDDAVTWASIHHKTSSAGGVQAHGYPDAHYLSNCNAELDAVGVPSLEACAEYVKAYKPPCPM